MAGRLRNADITTGKKKGKKRRLNQGSRRCQMEADSRDAGKDDEDACVRGDPKRSERSQQRREEREVPGGESWKLWEVHDE